MGILDYVSYKSPGSQGSGSLTNKAKVPSQKELRNKVSGEFLRRKLGEIKFKDGTYQGLELRKRIEQIYGKRGYSKTSEYQFTEDLRKAGVKEEQRNKMKKVWRSVFAKQQEEEPVISLEEAERNVRAGKETARQADEKMQSGESIIKGIKNSANYQALGIKAPEHQTSIRDSFTPANDYPDDAGGKAANKPLGVASGLGAMKQPPEKFNNKPMKGVSPIGFKKF